MDKRKKKLKYFKYIRYVGIGKATRVKGEVSMEKRVELEEGGEQGLFLSAVGEHNSWSQII